MSEKIVITVYPNSVFTISFVWLSVPTAIADFVSFLPPTRAPNCSREYQTLLRAFRQEIRPHLDMEQARLVLDTEWLEQVEALPQK
jgi:hypothetical protein